MYYSLWSNHEQVNQSHSCDRKIQEGCLRLLLLMMMLLLPHVHRLPTSMALQFDEAYFHQQCCQVTFVES
jgi:hypothetical protein